MNNRFAIIMIALVLIFGGIFWSTKKKSEESTGGTSSSQVSKHLYSEGGSGVVLTEFGDFECPACAQYYPLVKEVKEKYKDQVSFRFANFPLSSIHPNAMAAHRAAEAASLQNKFWEMHDMLYENHATWSTSKSASVDFENYAQQLGLDMTKFKTDVASSAVNNVIQADVKEGQGLDITGTPTFVLDGKKIEAPQSPEDFYKLLDAAIAAKKKQ